MGDRHGGADPVSGCLLVVVSEAISEWIDKGEVVDRYYNPGDRFDEVHVLLTNDDAPDPAAVQRLAGRASVHVHNLPSDRRLLLRTLGWRPSLLGRWTEGAVDLARAVQPDLVRCYGAQLNGACALAIRRALGTPVVVSLHTLPDDPAYPPPATHAARAEANASRRVRHEVIRRADLVLAVYASLLPYLERIGARRIELAYNVLNASALDVKSDYALHERVRVLCVGRQIPGKDPRALLQGIADLREVELTLVGDGSLHEELRSLVVELGLGDRVTVTKAVANDELVASLRSYDLFAAHTEYPEAPKAVLEAMLTGLPIVLNRRAAGPVPEFNDDVVLFVDGTAEGYRSGVQRLVADRELRERIARESRAWAERTLAPERAEQRVVDLYDELLNS